MICIKRFYLVSTLLCLLAVLCPDQSFAQDPLYPPPGDIYMVNDLAYHLYCTGASHPDAPTVILEAGVGGFSLNWSWVQPEIAEFAQVCSYDRPGYGWSSATLEPFSVSNTITDLHDLLEIAEIEPPYLMVGHSFGGVLIRAYQEQYPDEVVGMMLIESVDPVLTEWLPFYPAALKRQMEGLRLISGIARLAEIQDADSTLPIPTNVPKEIQDMYIAKLLEPNFFARSYVEAVFLADEMQNMTLPDDLGNLSIIIMRHGIVETHSFLGAPMTVEQAERAEEAWVNLQYSLTYLSKRAMIMTVPSAGHNIQFDRPAEVVRFIRILIENIEID